MQSVTPSEVISQILPRYKLDQMAKKPAELKINIDLILLNKDM